MNSLKKKTINMEITGHRGSSGNAPENTLSAIKQAVDENADYIEIDIHITKDEQIILMHDDRVDRTTNGEGYVHDLTYPEILRLDAGSWFDSNFKDERVPTLEEVIDLVQGHVHLNIEIKSNVFIPAHIEKLIQLIDERDFGEQCILTSFQRSYIEMIHHISPMLRTGLIMNYMPHPQKMLLEDAFDVLSCNYRLVSKDIVEALHSSNKEIHVWTVNERADLLRMRDYGVDNVITNYPGAFRKMLDN
ncbi:glycerophosphodiester phosphodiesterase [candidate division KSB1 bacterium]|nr:glycerophosphodiester phosphodiesterase [candidate division KSB1 bacterium]